MHAHRPSASPVAASRFGRRRLAAAAAPAAVPVSRDCPRSERVLHRVRDGKRERNSWDASSPGQPTRTGSGATVDLSWTASTVSGGATRLPRRAHARPGIDLVECLWHERFFPDDSTSCMTPQHQAIIATG